MKKLFKTLSLITISMLLTSECWAAAANAASPALPSPIFKFLGAMLGVLVSSLAIFGALKLYKKFIINAGARGEDDSTDSLDSPKDFKEAINLFLDKTDK